jgi:hypothetical protein
MYYCTSILCALLFLLASNGHAVAENWVCYSVSSYTNNCLQELDLDSVKEGLNGNKNFITKNSVLGSYLTAFNCSTRTIYGYVEQTAKWVEQALDAEKKDKVAALVCKR